LRDQYVRIKAIEALGRMRAYEAAELLRTLAESREGSPMRNLQAYAPQRKMRWR